MECGEIRTMLRSNPEKRFKKKLIPDLQAEHGKNLFPQDF
jgi:hypothetical protein